MDKQSHFQDSFSALVKCLHQSFLKGGIVSLPAEIVKPFRHPFSPTESSLLRNLQKVLESGRPKNVVRLDSQSFYVVASVILHFPYSETQNKLLYLFMDTIRQYQNEYTFAPVLSRLQGTAVSPTQVKEQGDYIGRKLGSCILRHLVSSNKTPQHRWRVLASPNINWLPGLSYQADVPQLAQFLSVLLRSCSVVTNQIMAADESQYLTSIIETGQNYFLRVLIADVVRELLFNGAERAALKKACSKPSIVDDFPVSKNGDSMWIGNIVDHLSGIDLARAFVGQTERMFRVQRLECDGNEYFKSPSPFVATVSSEISFLVPNGADMLTLFSIPISKNFSLNHPTSEPESSAVLEIRYPGIEGDRFINGAKGAINSLTVTLCDKDSVEAFIQMIEERRHDGVQHDVLSVLGTPKKHSIAFIELGSASADGAHENSARLNATATSEADPSSPLRNISLRTKQKQGSTKASVIQDHSRNIEPSASPGAKSVEDTPALKRPFEGKSLIERLRASQKGLKGVQSKDELSPRQLQLGQGNLEADVTEGAIGKNHPPSGASGSSSQAQHLDRDGSSPIEISKYKNTADLANNVTSAPPKKGHKFIGPDPGERDADRTIESTRKRPRHQIAMAKLANAEPGSKRDSQAGKGPSKTGLKRRTGKDSTALQNEKSQKPPKPASEAAEFDLPPSHDEGSRPAKKPKVKNSKAPAKLSVKESANMNSGNVQVSVSPKRHKHKAMEKKSTKLQKKKSQTTAASTRARRAAQTPKYVEASDESGEYSSKEATDPEDSEEQRHRNIVEEGAEDSLPLSKGAMENVLKASQLSFETNMREIVDGDTTDREDRSTEEPPFPDPSDNQAASNHRPVVQHASHKQTPARKEKHASISPDRNSVSRHMPGLKNNGHRKSNPRHNSIRLSESSIPPVTEKLLRKTKIVHFGPHGPANQAVQQKPLVTPVDHETTMETSPASEQSGFKQSERVEDIDDLVSDHDYELVPRSPEIEETQPSFAHHSNESPKVPQDGRGVHVDAHPEAADEHVIESHGESTGDLYDDQKASRYVISGAEDGASEESLQINEPCSSHKTGTQQFRQHIPLREDEVSPYDAAGVEQSQLSRDPIRKSIEIRSMADQPHPQSPKATSTSKVRAIHQTSATEECDRSIVTSDTVLQVSKGMIEPNKSAPPTRLHHTGQTCEGNTTSRILPDSILQAVRANADDIHHQPISSREADLQTIPQVTREPSTSLLHRVAEPMGPPPPPTIPLGSSKQPKPLRKSWPVAQADTQPIVPQKLTSKPLKRIISGPVRVKKSLSLPVARIESPPLEPELSPATPASFSTRLKLHLPPPANVAPDDEGWKTTEGGDTSQGVGNGSLTVVNEDETVFEDRSDKAPRPGRRRSDSEGDSFMTTIPFHRTGEGPSGGDVMVGVISARESQRGMVDAIVNITNDVLFRFGTEEDAMKAKVNQYDRGGNKVTQTLTDTWDQRLGHERRILGDVLKAEQEVLTTALQLVEDGQQSGGAWKETIYDSALTGRIQEKRDSLVRKIERLKNRS